MNKIKLFIASIGVLSSSVFAGTMGPESNPYPWSATGSIGYSNYADVFQGDGNAFIERLAIGKQVYRTNYFALGLEVGVQNGNDMRLAVSQDDADALGGLPIQSTAKPLMDLLATVKTQPLGSSALYVQVKGGIAYRRWQFDDRDTINDLSRVDGEVQAGIGLPIASKADLSLSYQGIFGGSPHFQLNASNQTGHVNNIPIQNGVLLGLTYTFS